MSETYTSVSPRPRGVQTPWPYRNLTRHRAERRGGTFVFAHKKVKSSQVPVEQKGASIQKSVKFRFSATPVHLRCPPTPHAMSLSLPAPVNTYAGENELRKANGTTKTETNGHDESMEDEGEYKPPRASDKLKAGIIYPPREIRGTSHIIQR